MTIKTANSVQQLITSISGNTINLGAATTGNRTLAAAISAPGTEIAVGAVDIAFRAQDDVGNWKNGKCTLTATGQVTQTSITASSAAGADVPLAGTVRTFSLVIDENDLNALLLVSDGIAPAALNDAGPLQASDVIVITRGGVEYRSTLAAIATLVGAAPSDVTAPTLTSPTGTQTGQTTATATVSTNEGNGTLYCLTNASPTATDAAIQAGTAQAVTSAGVKTFSITGLPAGAQRYNHFIHKDASNNLSAAVHSAAFTTAAIPSGPVYRVRTTDANGNKINGVSYFPDNTSGSRTMAGQSPNQFTRDSNTMVSLVKDDGTTFPAAVKFVWSKSSTQAPITYADNALPAGSVNGNTIAWDDAVQSPGLLYGNVYNVQAYLRGTPGTYYLWALTSDGFVGVYDNATGTPIGWTVI